MKVLCRKRNTGLRCGRGREGERERERERIHGHYPLPLQKGSERRAVLAVCRQCCITYSILLLTEYFDPPDIKKRTSHGPSCFMPFFLHQLYKTRPLPPGFMVDMVMHCHADSDEDDNLVESVCLVALIAMMQW